MPDPNDTQIGGDRFDLDLTEEAINKIKSANGWVRSRSIPICSDCRWCKDYLPEIICARPKIELVSGRVYYGELKIKCEWERSGAHTFKTLFGQPCGHNGIYWEPQIKEENAKPE